MNGCKKTRITRRFSHELCYGPNVFFEKLLPLGLFNAKPYFSSENKHSEGRCAGHRIPGCRGGVSRFGRFSSVKPVFFKLRRPCKLDCCSTKTRPAGVWPPFLVWTPFYLLQNGPHCPNALPQLKVSTVVLSPLSQSLACPSPKSPLWCFHHCPNALPQFKSPLWSIQIIMILYC